MAEAETLAPATSGRLLQLQEIKSYSPCNSGLHSKGGAGNGQAAQSLQELGGAWGQKDFANTSPPPLFCECPPSWSASEQKALPSPVQWQQSLPTFQPISCPPLGKPWAPSNMMLSTASALTSCGPLYLWCHPTPQPFPASFTLK